MSDDGEFKYQYLQIPEHAFKKSKKAIVFWLLIYLELVSYCFDVDVIICSKTLLRTKS